MVGWHQGAPTGQLSARSDEEMYLQGDGKHSCGTVGSCRVILETVMTRFPTHLWWVRVSGQKWRMCLLPVLRVKNLGVFLVILLYSGSAVTTRKTSFLYLTHASVLILGSSFSTLPASTSGRKVTISSVVQVMPLEWLVFKCPLHLPPAVELHGWCHPDPAKV